LCYCFEFFGILLLIAAFRLDDRDGRVRLVRNCFWFFFLPGLIYFIWRWQYFGWILPNTFYAKQGGELLHMSGFASIVKLFWITLPVLTLLAVHLAYAMKRERRRFAWMMMPAFVFPWLYLLIEQMQNIGLRFQFPVFPILLLLFAISAEALMREERAFGKRDLLILFSIVYLIGIAIWVSPMLGGSDFRPGAARTSAIISVVLFVLCSYTQLLPRSLERIRINARSLFFLIACAFMLIDVYSVTTHNTSAPYDHRVQMGKALRQFTEKKYTMVTTEAGWLPYYSEWRAVDPFGLYDAHIAHHGLDENYLNGIAPELIVFHVYSDSYKPVWVHNDDKWNAMTQKLYRYAVDHHYALAARVGVHHDCFWYFVRQSCADADTLIGIIGHQEGMQYTTPVD
jgi:hypothetical protein